MTTASAIPSDLRRPRWSKIVIGLLVAALTVVGLGTFAPGADASGRSGHWCRPTSWFAPLVGSWYAEVHFPGPPVPGVTATTMVTFHPGGGIREVNSVNPAPAENAGHWVRNRDCSYSVRLLVFDWDVESTGLRQLADIRLRFVMDGPDRFHSTSASATVHIYDPLTGQRQGEPIAIADISQTTGERLSVWKVPDSFPPVP